MAVKSDSPLKMKSYKLDPATLADLARLERSLRMTATGVVIEAIRRLASSHFGGNPRTKKSG